MAAGAALLVGLNGLIVMNVVSAVSGSVAALTSNVGKSLSAAEYDCGTSSDDDRQPDHIDSPQQRSRWP